MPQLITSKIIVLIILCLPNLLLASRYWIGPELWANRFQDWQLIEGRAVCVNNQYPWRTLHFLTYELNADEGPIELSVRLGSHTDYGDLSNAAVGYWLGAGQTLDYRARALIQTATGADGGWRALVQGDGSLSIVNNIDGSSLAETKPNAALVEKLRTESIRLKLAILPDTATSIRVTLTAISETEELNKVEAALPLALANAGSVSLTANGGSNPKGESFWFTDWKLEGNGLAHLPERAYGPVWSSLYTLSEKTLKLTAQFAPIGDYENRSVHLEVREQDSSQWQRIATARIEIPGWIARFKITDWNDTRLIEYRVVYDWKDTAGASHTHYYYGRIQPDPIDREEIRMAVVSCQNHSRSITTASFNFTEENIWFPHTTVVKAVEAMEPDFMFHPGDQIYEPNPTEADLSGTWNSYVDVLYHWVLWCWTWHELARNIPTVCILDDHDVYQINIWGANGRKSHRVLQWDEIHPAEYKGRWWFYSFDSGGFLMPATWVNMIQRMMSSHLPDPVDPEPVEQGIETYFTRMIYGGVDFALLEDRKFKSVPREVLPDAGVVNGFALKEGFDVKTEADPPGAELYGARQEAFLENWVADWDGVYMKSVLTQTIPTNLSTKTIGVEPGHGALNPDNLPIPTGTYPLNHEVGADMDSNGWPKTARDRFLDIVRKGRAFIVAGDQHLVSLVVNGIEDWGDAPISFCAPSVSNISPRRWFPHPDSAVAREEDAPLYTGDYEDAFGNKIRVTAVGNPFTTRLKPEILYDRATGVGLVRYNKLKQEATFEAYRRLPESMPLLSESFPGWPQTFSVEANDGRKTKWMLPKVTVTGLKTPPVIKIKDASGTLVYAQRLSEYSITPKVFAPGEYTVEIGEPNTPYWKKIAHLKAHPFEMKVVPVQISF